MGFKLKVEGQAGAISLGIESIKTVDFSADTPQDSNARSTDLGAGLTITGKILTALDGTADNTVNLSLWAMLAAEKSDCYRKVTVEVISAAQVIRQFILPNAFVVDYIEDYGDTEGVGNFKLVVKQKKDKLTTMVINGGYPA